MIKAYKIFEQEYIEKTTKSRQIFNEARLVLPGGVAHNAAYRKPYPLYLERAKGAKLWDVDGNEYIDFLCSGGPTILGHSPDVVLEAVKKQLDKGTATMVTHSVSIELAQKMVSHMPGLEMVRFVNSGSEAVHLALRVARVYTGKHKHAKCEGNYNGQLDNELVSGSIFEGTEDCPLPAPQGAGIPTKVMNNIVVLPWNNIEATVRILKKNADELAAVILEPVAVTWMGGIPAKREYIKAIKKVCEKENILLIYDEVVTGFRVSLQGAYSIGGVEPDLRAMAKLIGGGFPVGAYGGRREIMEKVVSPEIPSETGKMFSSGTYSGNPITMVAGIATLKELEKPGFYERIDKYGESVRNGIEKLGKKHDIPVQAVGVGSMFGIHFGKERIRNIRDIASSDRDTGEAFYMGLVANGIYVPPYHLAFISDAHTDSDIVKILEVSDSILNTIKNNNEMIN